MLWIHPVLLIDSHDAVWARLVRSPLQIRISMLVCILLPPYEHFVPLIWIKEARVGLL